MLIAALIVFLIALIGIPFALHQILIARADRRLLAATPTLPIARTPTGRMVEIEGEVVPGEQGFVVSPVSGRQAVLYRVDVYDTEGSVTHLYDAADLREFWLRDANGDHARILPAGARTEGAELRHSYGERVKELASGLRYVPMTPGVAAWASGVTNRDATHLMVDERVIGLNDRLLVIGFAERTAEGMLFLRHSSERELCLSLLNEQQLLVLRERQRKGGWIALVVFVGLAGIAVLLAAIGWWFDS